MKEMNQEAKDGLVEVLQKMLKEAQLKRKQSEELAYSAKVLEETAQKLSKEIEGIVVK
jgi:hypothetical protein